MCGDRERNTLYDGKVVVEAYGKGDPLAVYAIEKMAWMLGYGIANIVYIINPDCIILGPDYPNVDSFVEKVRQSIMQFVPTWVLRIFEASDYMLEIGIPALRILTLAWLVAIPALVISAGLQGLSMGMNSMILTVARQAVLSLIFAVIFSRFGNLDLLWSGFVLAEFLGILLAMWFWRKGYGRMEGKKL